MTMRNPPFRICYLLFLLCLTPLGAQGQDSAPPAVTRPAQVPHNLPGRARSHRKAKTGPRKIVVHQGGISEAPTQMSSVVPTAKGAEERAKSDRLLSATEANLKTLSAQKLTEEQQRQVKQIQQFMEQSRAALNAGDLTQGFNLASKANVLSEEFSKH